MSISSFTCAVRQAVLTVGIVGFVSVAQATPEDDLAYAISVGDVNAVNAALDAGADPNARPFMWQTYQFANWSAGARGNSPDVILSMLRLIAAAGGRASVEEVSREGYRVIAADDVHLGKKLFPAITNPIQYKLLAVRALTMVVAGALPSKDAVELLEAYTKAAAKEVGPLAPEYLERKAFLDGLLQVRADKIKCIERKDRRLPTRENLAPPPEVCADEPTPMALWADLKGPQFSKWEAPDVHQAGKGDVKPISVYGYRLGVPNKALQGVKPFYINPNFGVEEYQVKANTAPIKFDAATILVAPYSKAASAISLFAFHATREASMRFYERALADLRIGSAAQCEKTSMYGTRLELQVMCPDMQSLRLIPPVFDDKKRRWEVELNFSVEKGGASFKAFDDETKEFKRTRQ